MSDAIERLRKALDCFAPEYRSLYTDYDELIKSAIAALSAADRLTAELTTLRAEIEACHGRERRLREERDEARGSIANALL